MSGAKATLLVLGAGCAAMVGVAAAAVSLGSFFSDLPAANAASEFQLPAVKVKTITIVNNQPKPAASPASQPSGTEADDDDDGLHQADPRWARDTKVAASKTLPRQALEAAYADEITGETGAAAAASAELGADGGPFAMLVPTEQSASLESAVSIEPTVDLAAAVPHVPTPAPREQAAKPRERDDPPEPRAATTNRALSDGTTINTAANMRSAPRSGSGVMMVVPAGARVSIAPGCEHWCEISYNGRRGFVYRDYVGGSGSKARVRRSNGSDETQPIDTGVYGDSNFISSGKQSARAAAKPADEEETQKTSSAPPPGNLTMR